MHEIEHLEVRIPARSIDWFVRPRHNRKTCGLVYRRTLPGTVKAMSEALNDAMKAFAAGIDEASGALIEALEPLAKFWCEERLTWWQRLRPRGNIREWWFELRTGWRYTGDD